MSFSDDVADEAPENLERVRMAGRTVALVFTAMCLLGAALTWFMNTPIGSEAAFISPEERVAATIGVLLEAAIGAFVAWRFHVGKGFFAGIVLLLLLVLEVVMRLMSGSLSGIVISGLMIFFMGKAVMAAHQLRQMGGQVDAQDTFG